MPGRVRSRQAILAALLLLTRGSLAAVHGHAPAALLSTGCALALGGCLWWVAKRQINRRAGLLALLFYLASPVWHAGRDAATALALFVLLYTALGAAHAVQGPAKKWPPRFALLAALVTMTALLQPRAILVGLALAGTGMLYLGVGRRGLLAGVLGCAALLAALVILLHPAFGRTDAVQLPRHIATTWWAYAGDLAAWVSALAYAAKHRRSRFFGNTAPLLAATACVIAGPAAWVWALPFTLLFVVGVFADATDGSGSLRWQALVLACLLAQSVLAFCCAGGVG